MNVRESKLWTVVTAIAGFMGGWGFCAGGMTKVKEIEQNIIEGYSYRRSVDQCNLRGWILYDCLTLTFIALCLLALTSLIVVNVLIPLYQGLADGVGGPVNWTQGVASFILLHLIVFVINAISTHKSRAITAYSMFIWTGICKVGRFLRAFGQTAGRAAPTGIIRKVESAVDTAMAAAKEVKSNVCVVYDQTTPDIQFRRVLRTVMCSIVNFDESDNKLFLVSEDPTWPVKLRQQILFTYERDCHQEDIGDERLGELRARLDANICIVPPDQVQGMLALTKDGDGHFTMIITSVDLPDDVVVSDSTHILDYNTGRTVEKLNTLLAMATAKAQSGDE